MKTLSPMLVDTCVYVQSVCRLHTPHAGRSAHNHSQPTGITQYTHIRYGLSPKNERKRSVRCHSTRVCSYRQCIDRIGNAT